ncbi:hypothetical protein GCK32_012935, partial [Trichostrongylus colubriformis]
KSDQVCTFALILFFQQASSIISKSLILAQTASSISSAFIDGFLSFSHDGQKCARSPETGGLFQQKNESCFTISSQQGLWLLPEPPKMSNKKEFALKEARRQYHEGQFAHCSQNSVLLPSADVPQMAALTH